MSCCPVSTPSGVWDAVIDTRAARILAAADAYQAMREPRPHRPERSAEEAAAELRADVKAGRHDAEHIYAKINAPSRAAAGLFAMQHGLLPDEEFPAAAPA
jgi:HD-GYP domain-containing protein (c-di-GMP phosphodiesterase class II)